MIRSSLLLLMVILIAGCTTGGDGGAPAEEAPMITLDVTAPDPLAVPERVTPKGDDDWKAKANNKEAEVVETINILNPVAAYLTEGFKQYGGKFSKSLHEEWEDTQVQLTSALGLYDDCKKRRDAGEFNKKLFLDLEGSWQLLVKTGVAGIRCKSMMDAELQKIASSM